MANVTTTNLELQFKNAKGASQKVSISDPKEGLSRETVEPVIDTIMTTEIFESSQGDPYANAVGARYVRKQIEDIYVEEA